MPSILKEWGILNAHILTLALTLPLLESKLGEIRFTMPSWQEKLDQRILEEKMLLIIIFTRSTDAFNSNNPPWCDLNGVNRNTNHRSDKPLPAAGRNVRIYFPR